jgi:phosphonate transport system permease protein
MVNHERLLSKPWTPPSIFSHPWQKIVLLIGVGLYGFLGVSSINIRWERVILGLERAHRFFGGFFRPDFISKQAVILEGLSESLTMTVVSTLIGILLSIPIAFGAAKNLVPPGIYYVSRAIIALSRTFQEVIVAIFAVAMVGFGPLAGVLTLAFSSIGFIAKMLAEDIEEIDPVQLEAIRSTGAGWIKTMAFAVWPQIKPRLIGLSLYRLDINFRESAVIGIVGAGGIGGTLSTSFSRYEYETSGAILLIIIAIVFIAEQLSSYIRKKTS